MKMNFINEKKLLIKAVAYLGLNLFLQYWRMLRKSKYGYYYTFLAINIDPTNMK